MKHLIVCLTIAFVLLPVMALAHEGHEHKIMGTVSMVHQNQLEVKTKDGKSNVVTVNDNYERLWDAHSSGQPVRIRLRAGPIRSGRVVALLVGEPAV